MSSPEDHAVIDGRSPRSALPPTGEAPWSDPFAQYDRRSQPTPTPQPQQRRRSGKQKSPQPYVGSVLFFKHMILLVVFLLILTPTVFALLFFSRGLRLEKQVDQLQDQLRTIGLPSWPTESGEDLSTDNSILVAETPEYTQLYPDLYAPAVNYASEDIPHSVYLTFDDGPSAQTDAVLKVLKQYDVKATFFVVGSSDEAGLQRLRNIAADGHTLGIHSYSHDYQGIYASVEDYLADFYQCYCQVREATGVSPQVFRFPGGSINSYNQGIYQEIIAEMTRRGFVYFDWNSVNGDTASSSLQSAETLAANALEQVGYRRVILLMHDGSGKTTTPQALPAIIQGYRSAGYTLLPITPETRPITFGYRDWSGS